MGRSPCCSKEGLNRGSWTALEDKLLTNYIRSNGEGNWRDLPKRAGLKRCGKSCRLRWLNYLRPDIKRGNISSDEEELIIRLHNLLGNRWSLIAGRLPGRTDNEIKNYWNTTLRKKVVVAEPSSSSKKQQVSTLGKQEVELSDQSQPIRTKAFRCSSSRVNVSTNNLDHNDDRALDSNIENVSSPKQGRPENDQLMMTKEMDLDALKEFLGLDMEVFNFSSSGSGINESGMMCKVSHQSHGLDLPLLENWTHDDECLAQEKNGEMDMGFFLDCEGWP